MPPMGAFPGHIPNLDTRAYGTRHSRAGIRLKALDAEGLTTTKKTCGVTDAFTTYQLPYTDEANMAAVKDHITKPH
jgi:uncharacterized protein YqjF (DUF2071 family)